MQAPTSDTFSDAPNYVDAASTFAGSYGAADDSTMPMNSFDNEAALNQDLRTFFEQIMVPEFDAVGTDYVQPPPDLSAWMDEVEYFGQLDLFGANFVPAMDQIFEPQLAQDHISPALASVDDSGITSAHRRHRGDMHSGHIAHPRSPWYVYSLKDYLVPLTRHVGHGCLRNINMRSVSRRIQPSMVKIST